MDPQLPGAVGSATASRDIPAMDLESGKRIALAKATSGDLDSSPMEIVYRDLRYTVKVEDTSNEAKAKAAQAGVLSKLCGKNSKLVSKDVLKGLSGVIHPGRLTAVMGASGAGKTTMLNVLSGHVSPGAKVTGSITVNGEAVNADKMRYISGFVHQEDVIMDTMTVREVLNFTAELKLPREMNAADKAHRAMAVADMLNLTKALDNYVGSALLKGISGGEKRRLSLGMEMITNPQVLFLDEPTSGLDTWNAYKVATILRSLAHNYGRTVVATIHQPSSEIFQQFDDLVVLAEGEVLYHGPAQRLTVYFDRLGYTCPMYTNVADFLFMSVLNAEQMREARDSKVNLTSFLRQNTSGLESSEAADGKRRGRELERLGGLIEAWKQSDENALLLSSMGEGKTRSGGISTASGQAMAPVWTQARLLGTRALLNAWRNQLIIKGRLGQAVIMGLVVGLIYLNVTDVAPAAVQDRQGALFFMVINAIFGSVMGMVTVFGGERAVFSREHGGRMYGLPAYFWSRWATQIPIFIIIPLINNVITYFMIGFQSTAGHFFIFLVTFILLEAGGSSLGILMGCLVDDVTVAVSLLPMIILPLMVFSGFFINSDNIPVYFSWIQYISPMRYAFVALSKNEFDGLYIECPPGTPGCNPPGYSGDVVIQQLGFDDTQTIAECIFILLGLMFGYLFIAYGALWRVVRRGKQ